MNLNQLVYLAYARKGLITKVPAAIEVAAAIAKYEQTGQGTLFGGGSKDVEASLVDAEEIPEKLSERRKRSIVLDMLREEREMIGMCMTADPLGMYADVIASIKAVPIAELLGMEVGNEAAIAGYATAVTRLMTKKNKPFVRFKIEDATGSANCVMWSDGVEKFGPMLKENEALAIRCRLDKYNDDPQLVINKIKPLDSFHESTKIDRTGVSQGNDS